MEIVVDTLNSKIITDNNELLKALSTLYTFKVKGAEFTPAYRKRVWDGKISFIKENGVFKTGLLNLILSDLKKINCEPKLTFKQLKENLEIEIPDNYLSEYTLFPFQKELLKNALNQQRAILSSPTGSGKTIIIAGIVKAFEFDTITILFNSTQLVKQTYEFLRSCGFGNLGINFGGGYEKGKIMLSTIHSLDKIVDTHVVQSKVLIVDEVHEFSNGKRALNAVNSFPNAKFRFGLTATVPNDKIPYLNLVGAFGPTIIADTTSNLVNQGFLTKPEIHMHKMPTSDLLEGSYPEVYDTKVVHGDYRNNKILSLVNEIKTQPNARVLILVRSIAHGKILQKLIKENCYFLEGADNLKERYKFISKFVKNKNTSVLIGTKILQTGINIEEITHFINARALKSEIATLQALGRSLRKHESKTKVVIHDFLDTDPHLNTHAKQRLKHYKKEGHQIIIHEI